jgi:hypothetical protein
VGWVGLDLSEQIVRISRFRLTESFRSERFKAPGAPRGSLDR